MFNKKKKHFHNNNKPHYTRGPGGQPDPNRQAAPGDVPSGNQNPPANNGHPAAQVPLNPPAENQPTDSRPEAASAVPANADPQNQQVPTAFVPQNTAPQGQSQPPVQAQGQATQQEVSMCPICSMPIRSVNTAIHQKSDGKLVHFDCALRSLSREYYPKLGRFKKIYYVGAGNFAVIKEFYDKRGRLKNYEILEKIPYEVKEK